MSEQISQASGARRILTLDGWSVGAVAIAVVVLMPILSVVWIASTRPRTSGRI